MQKVRNTLALILASTLVSCSTAPEAAGPTAEEDLAAIHEAGDALLNALRDEDVPGIMAGLTDDHFTMAPDVPMVPTQDALREWHQNRVDLFSFEATHVREDVRLAGDLAIERWSGESMLIPRGEGEVVEDVSKGIWVWQRQPDGAWKLLWSIWNSDLADGIDWNVGEGG